MKFSAIIPAYNVEQYLPDCINSLLYQNIDMEIIIINDGSSDETGNIAEVYKEKNKNIRVIHQTNGGLSSARNRGLEVAEGEYIVFIDSDDWIANGALNKLYDKAVKYRADMVMGNNYYRFADGSERNILDIPSRFKKRILTGSEYFISLMEEGCYFPTVWSYIYRHEWIKKNNLRFDVGIIHEDELWTPIALCLADRVLLTDLDYYYYRIREGSIIQSLNLKSSLHGLFHVINRLLLFVEQNENCSGDKILKSWFYANISRIVKTTYGKLVMFKDSTITATCNDILTVYDQIQGFSPSNARERCEGHLLTAKVYEEKYLKWKNNSWDKNISQLTEQEMQQKKIILIYNNPEWHNTESIPISDIPSNYVFTLDRKYTEKAFAIVFFIPDLADHLQDDLEKPKNQIWIAWSTKIEDKDPWEEDEELKDLFDIWMIYQETSEIIYLYSNRLKKKKIRGKNPFIDLYTELNQYK